MSYCQTLLGQLLYQILKFVIAQSSSNQKGGGLIPGLATCQNVLGKTLTLWKISIVYVQLSNKGINKS